MTQHFSFRSCGFVVCTVFAALTAFAQTTGDFNGDGKLDVVQFTQCSPTPCTNSTIIVKLGKGNGQFGAPISSPTTAFPSPFVGGVARVAVDDFNDDHKLDIAFLSLPSGEEIAVAFGNGNGTFGSSTLYPETYGSFDLSIGDLNGDKKPDLVVAGQTVGVLLNNGDGTFRALSDSPGAFGECALADANHDGKLDLIGASIQLGNGDGTFQTAQTISGPGNCPLVADFNGDGKIDVIAGVQGGIDLYLGNGNGTFQSPIRKWLFPGQPVLETGDFNGDGRPDLLANFFHQADIALNTGNGGFKPPVGYLSSAPILGDFNGDGRTDVLMYRGLTSTIAGLARADGTLPLARSFRVGGSLVNAAYLGATDLNADGKRDLIIVNDQSDGWHRGAVRSLLGRADGTFDVQKSFVPTGTGAGVIGLADLNHDGKVDVVATGDSLSVLLSKGNGLFQPPQNDPIRSARGAIADVNGDGIPDLALAFGSFFQPQGIIMLGNGDGTFRNGALLPGSFDALVAGDFNHDGKQDLAFANSGAGGVGGHVGILLGNGDGTFQPSSSERQGQVGRVLAADFNNDGILDLVGVGTTSSFAATASVYLGTGTGTLQSPKNVWIKAGASFPGGTVADDFNKDGRLDVAVSLRSDETVILFGDGTGSFGSRSEIFGGFGAIVAGDFDDDGVKDLAAMTSGSTVAILLRGK